MHTIVYVSIKILCKCPIIAGKVWDEEERNDNKKNYHCAERKPILTEKDNCTKDNKGLKCLEKCGVMSLDGEKGLWKWKGNYYKSFLRLLHLEKGY